MQSPQTTTEPLGLHLICDIWGVNAELLNDSELLHQTMLEAAHAAGATVIDTKSHQFSPIGFTAITLLAESHISIHTWPEKGYAGIDVFTCGETMKPERCIEVFKEVLKPTKVQLTAVHRGRESEATNL